MKFLNICKDDFIKYKHELILTICYTLALMIVYASWAYSSLSKVWVSILIIFGFLILGIIAFIIWVNALKKKEDNTKGEK